MEHIVQFAIGIDDEAIKRRIAESAEKQIVASIKEAVDVLSNPIFDVVFTGFRVGYAHEFEGFAQYMDQNIWISNDPMWRFDIVSVRPVDFWNTSRIHNPILEGMKCPICGADLDPEKSKCDYCGYWWIYSPEG